MTAERSKTPRVSVVMNCHNSARYLRAAFDSVFAQTYTDWDIIFWDNASTDDSATIAKSYGEKVRYFYHPEKTMLGEARNLAMAKAESEFIAFIDCDDLWVPTKLEKQIPLFDGDPDVALVFCDTIFFDERGDVKQIYARFKPPRGDIFRSLLRNYYISMETVILRRSMLSEVGKWFEPSFSICTDLDLFLRIAKRWKCDYVDEPLAKWRIHPDSDSHKKYHLMATENEQVLEDFRRELPGFEEEYREELHLMRRKILWRKAMGEFRQGRPLAARTAIKNSNYRDPLTLGLCLLTYLPPQTVERAIALYKQIA